jgi:hypothetical protein
MDAMGKIQHLHNFVQKQRQCESENLTLPLTGDKSEGLWYTAAITSQGGNTMHINWFRDENNLIYINGATQLAELEKTLRFPGLEEAANELRQHPTAEGFTIKGPKRTSGRLFVPDLTFGRHIEMGENIFFFMGEMQECYVIYWPDAPVTQ